MVGNVLSVGTRRTPAVGIQVILKRNAAELTTTPHIEGAIDSRVLITIRIQLITPAQIDISTHGLLMVTFYCIHWPSWSVHCNCHQNPKTLKNPKPEVLTVHCWSGWVDNTRYLLRRRWDSVPWDNCTWRRIGLSWCWFGWWRAADFCKAGWSSRSINWALAIRTQRAPRNQTSCSIPVSCKSKKNQN